MIDTNLKGLLYVTKCIVPQMIERKSGHIINVSSLAGQEIYPQGNVYCASKHAVTALSKGLRMDLLQHNIKVTNISPGLAETEFSIVRFHGDAEKAKKVYEGFTPLKAEDIAEVIYFAATRPAHINLEEITILPTSQSDSRTVIKNNSII
jgi:NADP-dependent 3-hydroxy acid dehydrogenase YdfG